MGVPQSVPFLTCVGGGHEGPHLDVQLKLNLPTCDVTSCVNVVACLYTALYSCQNGYQPVPTLASLINHSPCMLFICRDNHEIVIICSSSRQKNIFYTMNGDKNSQV